METATPPTPPTPVPPERRQVRGLARRWWTHPRVLIGGGLAAALLVAFVLYWFQPQALFLDQRVDEGFPEVATATGDDDVADAEAPAVDADAEPADPEAADAEAADAEASVGGAEGVPAAPQESPAPPEPLQLTQGTFAGQGRYSGSGVAAVYDLDGERVLRLEDFATSNGPDLFVYLSAAAPGAPSSEVETEYVNLGRLRGNQGNQNYEIPADVDLSRFNSVVIWCDRFSVTFATAALAEV